MVLRSQPPRRQLQRVSRSKGMDTKQPPGHFTQFLTGLYLAPDTAKFSQPPVGIARGFGAQVAPSLKASNG